MQPQPNPNQQAYGYSYGYSMPQYGGAQTGMVPPPLPQPGMPQPGMMPHQPMPVHPMPGQPMPGQQMPGMMQPGMMQPGMMQPGMGAMPYQAVGGYTGPMPPQGVINPAIHQISQADAESAATNLYGAFKGIGADHKEVIRILSSYNKIQLSAIASVYYKKYGKSLESRIKDELTGHYEELALALFNPPFRYEAAILKKAISKDNPDYNVISGILTSRTMADIQQIVLAGMQAKRTKPGKAPKQKKNLMQEILKATKSYEDFNKLCTAIFNTRREMTPADPTRAASDAKDLIIAAKGIGCDSRTFISIMTSRSYPQIRKIAEEVEVQRKMSLKKLIYKEFTLTMEKGLATILFMAQSPAHAQAYVMYRAMKGAGTDDPTLISSIAYIYDNDMLDKVKDAYREITGKDLIKDVEKETSLNYKKLCTALLTYKGKKHGLPMNTGY